MSEHIDKRTFLTKEELNRYPAKWLQEYKNELEKRIEHLSETGSRSVNELLRQRNRILKALERKDVKYYG